MRLGFIGFGEAAYEMSKGLKNEGFEDITAFDIMHEHPIFGPTIKERIEQSGVKLVYTAKEVVDIADVLIVAVPGSKALDTAKNLLDLLHNNTIYVDVSASTVDVKRKLWEIVREKTDKFVDIAMLGPLPMHQHKVPMAASGTGADMFIELMEPYGMNIEKISETAGDATSIKLVRSIFIKGLASLLLEVVEVSSKIGVTDLVIESISNTIDEVDFDFTINRLITSSVTHADRRVGELKGAIEMLEDLGIDSTMTKAAKSRLEWLAAKNLNEKFGGITPKTIQEVVQAL